MGRFSLEKAYKEWLTGSIRERKMYGNTLVNLLYFNSHPSMLLGPINDLFPWILLIWSLSVKRLSNLPRMQYFLFAVSVFFVIDLTQVIRIFCCQKKTPLKKQSILKNFLCFGLRCYFEVTCTPAMKTHPIRVQW